MATKEQYEFFRFLYEEEERRYAQLEGRARLYLSVIALFLATILFKAGEVRGSAAALGISWVAILGVGALLVAALLLVVLGMLIRTFEGVADAADVIESFGDAPPTNEDFFDNRIADFAAASARNTRVNNQAALCLSGAAICLALAMALLAGAIAVGLYRGA